MPANTYTLIEKIVVGAAGASSITFTSIPQTYTDLKVVASARNTGNGSGQYLTFNGSSTSYSAKRLIANNGSTVTSHNGGTTNIFLLAVDTRATANSFGSAEFYIPNYTSSNNKSVSLDSVNEENGNSYAYDEISAGLWSNSAAITSITLTPEAGNFAQYSSFSLYGIAKEGVSPSASSAPYATGGDLIYTDGTYWIHVFNSSGTFTPRKNLSCQYLVIAGGGGGGNGSSNPYGGGGGAGGYRCSVTGETSGGGASAETPITVSLNTNYTVTVGGGGASQTNGSNSSISGTGITTITSTGGGRGGYISTAGADGGSGGGGAGGSPTSPGNGTANQGYGGGTGYNQFAYGGGGGGGAAAVGNNGSSDGGTGGAGRASSITGSSVTRSGGGGAAWAQGSGGVSGGAGGGGAGGNTGNAATANTGGGGGGGATSSGGAGGSGIVIVRYLK